MKHSLKGSPSKWPLPKLIKAFHIFYERDQIIKPIPRLCCNCVNVRQEFNYRAISTINLVVLVSIKNAAKNRMSLCMMEMVYIFTKFPDTISAVKILAPLRNSDHALLFFEFGLHDSHEPTRPRVKWCHYEGIKRRRRRSLCIALLE